MDRLDAETSRQRKNFEHNFQLVMWTLAILFAVGAHKLMSLFMSATSRTDTFKDKRLIESCGIVSQLKVSERKELLVDRFWPHVYAPTSQMTQDEDCGAI